MTTFCYNSIMYVVKILLVIIDVLYSLSHYAALLSIALKYTLLTSKEILNIVTSDFLEESKKPKPWYEN